MAMGAELGGLSSAEPTQDGRSNLFLKYSPLIPDHQAKILRVCQGSEIAAWACVMPFLPCCAEAHTPASRLMPSASQTTPAESVGSAWAPDAASALRRPAADGWPSNGFGRVLDEGVDLTTCCISFQ